MQKFFSIKLLKIATPFMVGILALLILYDALLLLIALVAPAYWPKVNTLTTAIPGFELPTIYLPYRLLFVGRQVATIALAALIILPIAGIVRSLDKEGAFTSANILRLRLVAIGCAIYGLGPTLVPLIPLSTRITLGFLHAYVNFPAVAMSVVALALAEIFKEGRSLREDVQATI